MLLRFFGQSIDLAIEKLMFNAPDGILTKYREVSFMTMGTRPKLSVLFLGKRGGGARFAVQVAQELEVSLNFEFQKLVIRRDNVNSSPFDQSKIAYLFDVGVSIKSALEVLNFALSPDRLLKILSLSKGDICFVPMISPLGLCIERILERKGIRVLRVIHDASPHPGEVWPRNRTIRKVVRSSKVLIALSNHVATQLFEMNPNIKVVEYCHPVFQFPEVKDQLQLPTPYILFLGRIREYKGVPILIEAFKKLGVQNLSLVIAGEGQLRARIPKKSLLLNRWLSEEEISELIIRAEIIAFPYIESSQSGLIPYCMKKNKKIVVSPSQGLLEQSDGYENRIISQDYSGEGFAAALRSSIQMKAHEIVRIKNEGESIEKCLLKALYVFK
jgi:glycosyltransferase involved in cell wall biosynthesis